MAIRKPQKKPLTRTEKAERERAVAVIRSEGQRLLTATDASISEIAAACGVSRQTAIDWRLGRKSPTAPHRASLWNAYQIPAHAWGRLPVGVAAAAGDADELAPAGNGHTRAPGNGHAHADNGHAGNGHAVDAATASSPNSLDETAALLGQIRRQLGEPDLLPSDRVRITDSYTRTLALQARLQREVELTEDRIIREHPTWRRIRAEIARVLSRYPQVAAEVCEALERLHV